MINNYQLFKKKGFSFFCQQRDLNPRGVNQHGLNVSP